MHKHYIFETVIKHPNFAILDLHFRIEKRKKKVQLGCKYQTYNKMSGFGMAKSKMASNQLETGPFINQTALDHSNTKHIWYSGDLNSKLVQYSNGPKQFAH